MHKISGFWCYWRKRRYSFLLFLLLPLQLHKNEKWNKEIDSSRRTRITLWSLTLCVLYTGFVNRLCGFDCKTSKRHCQCLEQQSALVQRKWPTPNRERRGATNTLSQTIFVIAIKLIKRYESDSITKQSFTFDGASFYDQLWNSAPLLAKHSKIVK